MFFLVWCSGPYRDILWSIFNCFHKWQKRYLFSVLGFWTLKGHILNNFSQFFHLFPPKRQKRQNLAAKSGDKIWWQKWQKNCFLVWCSGPYRDTFWIILDNFFIYFPPNGENWQQKRQKLKKMGWMWDECGMDVGHILNNFRQFFHLFFPKRRNLAAKTAKTDGKNGKISFF